MCVHILHNLSVLYLFIIIIFYLRWLEYKPYGTVISGTKILPFKVPLKEVSVLVNKQLKFVIKYAFRTFFAHT